MILGVTGASKTLSTLIEGESLLNDGAAIVVFNIFQILATPGGNMTGEYTGQCMAGKNCGCFLCQISMFENLEQTY